MAEERRGTNLTLKSEDLGSGLHTEEMAQVPSTGVPISKAMVGTTREQEDDSEIGNEEADEGNAAREAPKAKSFEAKQTSKSDDLVEVQIKFVDYVPPNIRGGSMKSTDPDNFFHM